ncbi:hypothetical protein AVEN_270538-1 [Araneus ventricosus]|uniref:Uncharacterized protein n=1 Tax=Araneus ventricosus TaxID=182803 RepID=A0A4Y2B895_ARAVE|nr:hypothetical protein AVEN_270538-1 [Araneus ventricosus]
MASHIRRLFRAPRNPFQEMELWRFNLHENPGHIFVVGPQFIAALLGERSLPDWSINKIIRGPTLVARAEISSRLDLNCDFHPFPVDISFSHSLNYFTEERP